MKYCLMRLSVSDSCGNLNIFFPRWSNRSLSTLPGGDGGREALTKAPPHAGVSASRDVALPSRVLQ